MRSFTLLSLLFATGLACGYLMVKSDSIWGAVLIHVAADLFLFISTLANA
jgi:membrane protease YdiL (CAAX protease family)